MKKYIPVLVLILLVLFLAPLPIYYSASYGPPDGTVFRKWSCSPFLRLFYNNIYPPKSYTNCLISFADKINHQFLGEYELEREYGRVRLSSEAIKMVKNTNEVYTFLQENAGGVEVFDRNLPENWEVGVYRIYGLDRLSESRYFVQVDTGVITKIPEPKGNDIFNFF